MRRSKAHRNRPRRNRLWPQSRPTFIPAPVAAFRFRASNQCVDCDAHWEEQQPAPIPLAEMFRVKKKKAGSKLTDTPSPPRWSALSLRRLITGYANAPPFHRLLPWQTSSSFRPHLIRRGLACGVALTARSPGLRLRSAAFRPPEFLRCHSARPRPDFHLRRPAQSRGPGQRFC